MASQAIKHSNQALAFMALYKTMAPQVQKEVKEMIEIITENQEADLFTTLAFQAWDMENDQSEQENAIWEKHYKEPKGV